MFSAGSIDGTGLLWNLWTEINYKVLPMADRHYNSGPSTCSLEVLTKNLQRMTADAIERGCDPNMVTISHHENILHLFIESYYVWRDCGGRIMPPPQIIALVKQAIALGCDLETRDSTGKTPLLTAAQYHNYQILVILIQQVTNVTAIDNLGQNALHLLLNQPTELTEWDHKCLQSSLVCAIGNKCDPNQLSINRGLSPLNYTEAGYGWVPWTEALARLNCDQTEISSMSEDEKLLFSDMTLGSWKAERNRIRKEYEERGKVAHSCECDCDGSECISEASVYFENITEWVYDSEV